MLIIAKDNKYIKISQKTWNKQRNKKNTDTKREQELIKEQGEKEAVVEHFKIKYKGEVKKRKK